MHPPPYTVCNDHLIATFLSFHMSLVVVMNFGAGNALRGFEISMFSFFLKLDFIHISKDILPLRALNAVKQCKKYISRKLWCQGLRKHNSIVILDITAFLKNIVIYFFKSEKAFRMSTLFECRYLEENFLVQSGDFCLHGYKIRFCKEVYISPYPKIVILKKWCAIGEEAERPNMMADLPILHFRNSSHNSFFEKYRLHYFTAFCACSSSISLDMCIR